MIPTVLFSIYALMSSHLYAGDDKPFEYSKLPEKAKTFISTHFSNYNVALTKSGETVFEKEYEVIIANGDEVEFDSKGNWKEVDCQYSAVPTAIIPKKILDYIEINFPDQYVIKIERDTRKYEVELDNKIEIEFNAKFEVSDIDFD